MNVKLNDNILISLEYDDNENHTEIYPSLMVNPFPALSFVNLTPDGKLLTINPIAFNLANQ